MWYETFVSESRTHQKTSFMFRVLVIRDKIPLIERDNTLEEGNSLLTKRRWGRPVHLSNIGTVLFQTHMRENEVLDSWHMASNCL